MGSTRADVSTPRDDCVPLRVDLRQWVLGLDLAELIVVHGWIRAQLFEVARRPSVPFVRVPDDDDALTFAGETFLEMASRVRLYICALPKTYLIVLESYLDSCMQEHDGG